MRRRSVLLPAFAASGALALVLALTFTRDRDTTNVSAGLPSVTATAEGERLGGVYPPGTRTGHEALDRFIAAVESGDLETIASLAALPAGECAPEGQGTDRAPVCPPGADVGAQTEFFLWGCVSERYGSTDARYSRQDVVEAFRRWLAVPRYLVAAYTLEPPQVIGDMETELAVIFASARDTGPAPAFLLTVDGHVIAARGCGVADESVPAASVAVLAPPQARPEVPPAEQIRTFLKGQLRVLQENMRVALGFAEPCESCVIVKTVFVDYIEGVLAKCEKVSAGSFRSVEDYDAGKHDAVIRAIESGCSIVTGGRERLGLPAEPTDEWREVGERALDAFGAGE